MQYQELYSILASIIKNNVTDEAWHWLELKAAIVDDEIAYNIAFASVVKKMGKQGVLLNNVEKIEFSKFSEILYLEYWTIDRIIRIWLLMQLDRVQELEYIRRIQTMFIAADMNELVALYSALPILQYPEAWIEQCTEGIRNNMEIVLQAIMYFNSYPANFLSDSAWNQMILKAFFTNQDISKIWAVDDRNNQSLANMLVDFAHERWAAGRETPIYLWRLVGKYINDVNFETIVQLFGTGNDINQKAAALACYSSDYLPAKQLLNNYKHLKTSIETCELNWESINNI